MIGLISNFENLSQSDLIKKLYAQFCKTKTYFKLLINHQVDCKEIKVRCSSKMGYLSLFKSF